MSSPLLLSIVVKDSRDFSVYDALQATVSGLPSHLLKQRKNLDVYTDWVNTGYRKTVKRLKPKYFDKLEEVEGVTFSKINNCEIALLPIVNQEEENPSLRRAQASNWSYDLNINDFTDHKAYHIVFNESLGMSFGKIIAAAGHCIQLVGDKYNHPFTPSFDDISYRLGSPEPGETVLVKVVDSGFTEVDPGSVTAWFVETI